MRRVIFIFIFLRTSSVGGGGGEGGCQIFFCFPVQQTTSGIGHRGEYQVVFFGLATNTLNARNNNNNNIPTRKHLLVVRL